MIITSVCQQALFESLTGHLLLLTWPWNLYFESVTGRCKLCIIANFTVELLTCKTNARADQADVFDALEVRTCWNIQRMFVLALLISGVFAKLQVEEIKWFVDSFFKLIYMGNNHSCYLSTKNWWVAGTKLPLGLLFCFQMWFRTKFLWNLAEYLFIVFLFLI